MATFSVSVESKLYVAILSAVGLFNVCRRRITIHLP